MTPPAAAAARTRSRRAAPPPRRVSGPVRGRPAVAAGPPPLALRLGGVVQGLAEHRLLDRVIRGRAWIAIVAVGLIGIVFMQVSMLRMNAGIGRAVERAAKLERDNAAIRASISELSAGDRIAAEAAQLGFVVAPGTARFLDARQADVGRAVAAMTPPGQGVVASPSSPSAGPPTVASPLAPTGVAPGTPGPATPAASGGQPTPTPAPAAGQPAPAAATGQPAAATPTATAPAPGGQPSARTTADHQHAVPPGATTPAAAATGGASPGATP